jgi:hypothetical protein
MKGLAVAIILTLGALAAALPAAAHPGGLNADGCHNNRKTGDYHCHRGGGSSAPSTRKAPRETAEPRHGFGGASSGGAFVNCDAARAAGAAPVRRGEPGYGPHLDRDDDGVGCEPRRR